MEIDKKMAAAIAAVMAYIESEEEAVALQAASAPRPEAPAPPLRLWGLNGRQTMMQLRNLMQLKAFHGTRWR